MTNNKAKYEALLAGLNLARVVGASSMVIRCDSQVVTGQVNKDCVARGKHIRKYLNLVKWHVSCNSNIRFVQVLREENADANHLAKVASAEGVILDGGVLYSYSMHLPRIR